MSTITKQTRVFPAKSSTDRPRLIRLPEVLNRVGLSRSTVYNRVSTGSFPAPIKLGEKSVAWLEADVDAWIHDRVVKSSRGLSA